MLVVLGLIILTGAGENARAQDIAPFRLTDVSGELQFRYTLYDRRNESLNSVRLSETAVWQELLYISTQSYVYHPGFLSMSIGGGPVFAQSESNEDGRSNSGDSKAFNFDASFSFLSYRPYAFSLYYLQSFPQTSSGLSGSFTTAIREYGAKGMINPTKSRFFLQWSAGRREGDGSGAGAIVDDFSDAFAINGLLPMKKGRDINYAISWSDSLSRSGNVGLPIQESRITGTRVRLNTDYALGSDGKYKLRQDLTWNSQDVLLTDKTRQDRLNYNADMGWASSENTEYYARLAYNDVDRSDSWSRSGVLRAGFRRQLLPRDLVFNGSGNFSRTEAPGFVSDQSSLNTGLSYRESLPFGILSASARVGLRLSDQQSSVDFINVFDEVIPLVGTTSAALSRDFVVAGSIVVTNDSKTQTYLEGIDYRLIVIGGTTSIERLITGNIVDGESVLVSYQIQTGGTVKYRSITDGVSVNLTLPKYVNFNLSYSSIDNEISSGFAITPLNDSRSIGFGAQIDYPLGRWTLGGSYQLGDTEADITSSTSQQTSVHARVSIGSSTSMQLGAYSYKSDIADSMEDLDQQGLTFGLNSFLPGGWSLRYSGRYSENDGGSVFREELRHNLNLNWGYRLVRVSIGAVQSVVTQGNNEQKYLQANARLTRYFR